jgi:hypothetical protein
MFETPQEVKPSASKGLWLGIAIVVLIAAGAAFFFIGKRGSASNPGASMSGAAAQAKGPADAVHDLRIQRATMAKDRNGAMSVWSVSIENKSSAYTYSKIKYETTYISGNGQVLMTNNGTLAEAIAPGEERSYEANDPIYPAATATYNFKITSATSAVQQ